MNDGFGTDGDREHKIEQPVAYVISGVEGIMDEATIIRYGELAGPD